METSLRYIQESEILSRINRNCVSLSPILTLTHSPCFQIVSKSFARVSSRIPLLEAQRQKRGPTPGDSRVTIDWPGLWSLNPPRLYNLYIYIYTNTYTIQMCHVKNSSGQISPFGQTPPIFALGLPHFSPPARLGPLRRTRVSMAETCWWLRNSRRSTLKWGSAAPGR